MPKTVKSELCVGCKYNTYKTQGGQGKICNGETMAKKLRCPEWAINEFTHNNPTKDFSMHNVIEYMKVK